MNATPPLSTAAFVRVEQVLLPPRVALATLYLTAQAPGVGDRLARLGAVAGSLPALGALGLADRRLQGRLTALHLRGLTRDRVEVLAPELYDTFVAGRLRASGLELIARARAHGHAVILVSHGLEVALRPLVEAAGADALVGATLEWRDDLATGKLLPPALCDGADAARAWARSAGFGLRGSYAYGSDLGDAPLLEAVGFPCAVRPDWRLRRLARRRGWPVLDLAEAQA